MEVCEEKCNNVFFTDTFIENVYAPVDKKREANYSRKLVEFSQTTCYYR